jgi:type IV pilus assembly protein PilX
MQHGMSLRPSSRRRGRGISLPVVLMFLLVITILGTLGVRRATVGETLSRNQLDYEVARQSTEAALRDAERDLLLNVSTLMPNALCARGADRPVASALSAPSFDSDCPRGQCRFELSYYDTSNYLATPVVNPEPWWPTVNSKKGLWDGDPAAVSAKPGDATGAGTNCTFKGSVPLGTFTGLKRLAGVARQPEYLIEYLARGDDKVMRITARGFGADINTEVVMQTYFRPYLP